jgi:hypothetical protein
MNVGGASRVSLLDLRDNGVSIFAKTHSRQSNNADTFLFPFSPARHVLYCVNSLRLAAVCSVDFSHILSV